MPGHTRKRRLCLLEIRSQQRAAQRSYRKGTMLSAHVPLAKLAYCPLLLQTRIW